MPSSAVARAWRAAAACAAAFCAAGCRGSSPATEILPEMGMAAVLVRGRLITPTGETSSGRLHLNLDSDADSYRLPFTPRRTSLFAVEPATYRLSPTRGLLGGHQPRLKVVVNGRAHYAPFPRDILRREPIRALPGRVCSLGVLEARLETEPGEAGTRLSLRLDDSVDARRSLVEDMIDSMLDPKAPPAARRTAVAWTRALDQALSELLGTKDRRPAFKPGQ